MADKKKKINSALSAAGRAASKTSSNVADQLKKKRKSAQQAAQMQESQKKLPSWYGSIDTSKPRVQQRSTTSTAKGRSVFAPQQQTTTQTASPAVSMWPIVPKKASAGLPSLAQVYGAPYRSDLAAYLPSRRGQGTLEPSDVTGVHYVEWMSDMADQKAFDEYRQQMVQSAKPQMKYQQHYNFETDRKRVERLEYQLRFENDPEERQRMQGEIVTILAGAGTDSPEANEYARQYYQEKQDRADRSAARRRDQANAATTIVDQIRSGNYDWSRESDEGEQRLVAGLQAAKESGNQTVISAYERSLEEYRKNPGLYAGNAVSDEEKQATSDRYLKRSDMLSDLTQEAISERDAARRGVYQSKANQYYLDMDRRFGFTAASQQPDFKEQSKAPKKEFTYPKAITVNGNPMLINQPFEDDYHWDYMTDEEKATAIYLFNTKGDGTAKAYIFDYLGPGIDKVYAQDQQAKIYDDVSSASGLEKALYSGASVLTNAVYAPMSYLNNAGQVVGNLIADKRGVGWTPVNSYSEFSRAARNTRISRQAVADSMGSVGAFFYQTGMSMLDNMILLPTGQTGTLGLMALEAADAQYAEDIDNGVDPETAAISGAIAGGIETLTETVSLEHLFKAPDVESFLRGLGKQAIFEGSEEGASDVLNLIRERALYGETSYGTTEEEHKAWFRQLLLDIAGGAVAGAGMYAGYGGPQYVARRIGETKASGLQVLANDNGAALAQAYTDATGKPANAPRSVFQTGRVLQKTLNQGAKNYNATYAQETGDAAVQYYQDNQQKDQEADKKASDTVYAAIRKVLADKKLTRREQAAMDSIPGVREAVAAYRKGGAMEGTVNREGSAKIKRGIENALLSVDHNLQSAEQDGNVEPKNRASERMQQTAQGVQKAAQERKAAMQMREEDNAQSQVNGQDVELLGMTSVGDKATLNVRNQDGQVQEVNLNDVTYGSDRKATAYAIGADMENTALANSFVATLADNQVPARVAAGMQAAYDYAYGGAPSVESLKGSILTEGLNDAQLSRAFELGQQARQAAVQMAQETKMKQALKQANVEWKGGTVDTSRLDMASLNAEQQRQVNLVQLVAGVTGMNMELFQSKADANGRYHGENGSYNARTNTIRLDVNAGANSAYELSRVTLLRTMSHELTHALQQNSPAQYDALKRAVLDVLTSKSGASIEEMAARMRERDSSLKDDGAALDEVVAEACENMLRDSDAMEQLIARHPAEAKTFLEKVKQFFTDIVNAIRAAFGGSDTSRSREATALMQQAEEYLDICEKWSKALQDTAEISGRMYTASEDSIDNTAAFTDSAEAIQNQARPPYTDGTKACREFVDGLSSDARSTYDLLYNFYQASRRGKRNLSSQYMYYSDWNTMVAKDASWAETAQRMADSIPEGVRKRMGMNTDGTLNPNSLEEEFRMNRSMGQRIIDALELETIDPVYKIGDREIRLSTGNSANAVGGEAYRRALCAETRKAYANGTLKQVGIGTLSRDRWGSLGFLAVNGKTGASGDFTTLCPQMFYNKGCHYCYRLASLKSGVNNKLVGVNVWYGGEILRIKDKDVDMLNKNGGLRIQSFGDWMPQFSAQLADMLYDADMRGLQIKIITKEPSMIDYVAQLKRQGIGKALYFNLSADYAIERAGSKETADYTTFNAERPYMRDDAGDLWWKRAMTVEEASRYRDKYSWVNTRIVATTVDEFIRGLRDPRVDVVTGYHGNIRSWERIDSTTGEVKVNVEALGDSGMPVFGYDAQTGEWHLEKQGKTKTHQALAAAIEENGLQYEYYAKSCCITGRCATCNGKCGKLARNFYVKNATNRDVESFVYWQENMEYDSDTIADQKVQYSMRDETYLAAVEDGDMQKAQAMVDEAARQAGYTRKLYHGTQYQFNQFMRGGEGIHLGTFEAADFVRRTTVKWENQGRMIEAYVRLDNPMYVPYDIQRWNVENLRDLIFAANGLQTSKELLATTADGQQIDLDFSQVEGIPQITKKAPRPARSVQVDEDFGTSRRKIRRGAAVQTETATTRETNRALSDEEQLSRMKTFDEIAEWLKARGIDGIEYINAIEDKNSTSVLVFDSNQVKLADPVTYDDQGDVIPLSERFNSENDDIRYQMRDDDDGDQGLVGIFDEAPRLEEAHIDQRTWDNMSDRRVHSFMNDYPASRMWLARMASILQSDVTASTAGQRLMNEGGTFMGQKRDTTPLLAEMKDSGYTWQQMADVFGKMAEVFENGDLEGKVPETAIWKRAELILDRAVTEGYTDMNGIEYRPDAGYMRYKDALPGAKAREIPANAVEDTFEDVDNRLAGGGNAAAQTGGDGERVQLQGDTSYQEKQQSAKSGIALMDGGPSNRELLSSALESAAQTPEELRYVQSYKKQAQKIAEMEGLLAERRAEVQRLQDMKNRTADQEIRMKNLQQSIAETESMIDKRDKGLLKMEAMEPLRNVLDRERANYRETLKQAKKDAAARQREKDAAKLDNTLLATQMHEGREWAAKLHEAENRVAEANQKVEDLKAQSLADRMHESSEWAAKLRKAENQLATAKRQLETAQMQRIAERMAEGRKWAEKVRQAKEQADRRAARLREQADRRVEKIQDKADRRTLQGKIIRRVKALDTMLRTPSNTRHVPDALRGATANILQYFTDESKIFKAEDMQAAANAYAALNTEENSNMAEGMYDPDTYERMVALMEVTKKGQSLKNLSMDELTMVDKVLQNLSHIIQNANAVFVNGKRRNLEELVNEEQQTLQEKGRYGSFTLKDNAFVDMLRRGNITAPYFFKHLGGPLGELGTAILNGETAFGVETGRATERFRAIEEKYHRDAWKNKKGDTLTLKNGDGDKIQLTREQAMSVWATWKREHSIADRETHHLDQGGILLQQEKKLFKKTYAQDSAFRINTAEMVEIDKWLTQEQKNYVDEVVSYLSTDIAELGNITSNALHGYSKFGEGYYYPFRTSDEFRPTKIGKDENAMPLKLMGFTKSVRSKSNAPVIVTDFTSTASDHINSMLTYYAFAEAQDNFMRLYNFRMDQNHSIKRSLSGAYGANPGKFIRAFMNDMYGGVGMSMNERDANRFLSAFKKGAVMASLSVAIQQSSSIMRAMALIDPKYFVGKPLKGGFAEAKKYAGTAVIKDMGSFDTSTGRSAVQYITGDGAKTAYGKFSEKVGDVGGWLPEKMDAITWGRMWSAVKRETAARTGLNVNSEELKVQAGKRFDEVMRLTQVYDSTLAKSELMREKNMWAKMVTAFMAEATVTYNMLMDAVIDAKGKRFGAATKSVGSVIAATILNTLLSSVIYAMRDDDDKDATYFERYVKSVVGSLDPIDVTLNLVPMVKDVYEIFRGYDVERTDMSVFNDIYTYSKVLSNPDKSWLDRLKSGVSLAGIITGIPAKNLWRDIEGTVNTFKTVKDTDYRDGAAKMAALQGLSEWAFGPDVSETATIDKLVQAMAKGDQAETAAQMKTLSTFYEGDEKKRKTAIKKAGKEAYLDGDLTDAQALRVLEGIGITGDEADKVLLDWQYAKKTGGKTVSGAGSDYLEGEIDRETALDALARTGAEEEDVETRMRKLDYQKESGISYSGLQDAYTDGRISRAEALRVRTEIGGQKPDEAEKTLLQWDYEKDTGRKWADMQKDYAAGTITDKQAVDYLVKYGDKKSDAASETVAKWKYEKSTGKKWDEMQDDYLDGSLTKAQAMSAMQKYGGKTEAEAYWTVDEWDYREANPDADGYSKFHRVTELAGRGQSISGAVKEIYAHSDYKTAKDCGSAVTSALTSYWKPLYIAATPAQRELMEPIMLAAYRAAYETLGETYYGDKRRLKSIRKWLED